MAGNLDFSLFIFHLSFLDSPLQFLQELCSMSAIHLGMVKLERDGEGCLEPTMLVASPCEEGIVEDAAVLVHDAVKFRFHHGRCAHNHRLFVRDVATGLTGLLSQCIVVTAELRQIIVEGDVAGADAPFAIVHNHIDGQTVVSEQLPLFGQKMELIHLACCLADAPAQEHVELQAPPFAHLI